MREAFKYTDLEEPGPLEILSTSIGRPLVAPN